MTPIERVSIKSQALAVLGLNNTTASASDIKSAYRACVKEKHPDRCNGASEEFIRITDAFDFLSGETDDFDPNRADERHPVSRTPRPTMDFSIKPSRPRSSTMSRPISKPAIQTAETRFSTDALSACKNLLGKDQGLLATHMQRVGRKLAYFVPVKILSNVNKVALPTGDLVDSRRILPTLLTIESAEITSGVYKVPSELAAEHFPGARSVEIRFVADV